MDSIIPCVICGAVPDVSKLDEVKIPAEIDCILCPLLTDMEVDAWNINQTLFLEQRRKDFEAGAQACGEMNCTGWYSETGFDDYLRKDRGNLG